MAFGERTQVVVNERERERERERMQETLWERERDVGEYKHWLGVVVW